MEINEIDKMTFFNFPKAAKKPNFVISRNVIFYLFNTGDLVSVWASEDRVIGGLSVRQVDNSPAGRLIGTYGVLQDDILVADPIGDGRASGGPMPPPPPVEFGGRWLSSAIELRWRGTLNTNWLKKLNLKKSLLTMIDF